MNCLNCDEEVISNYCGNCGQAVHLKRIDKKYIIHEIEHVLHFERGILYTIKELFINPGENVRNYLKHDRNRLVKPIIFIVITSLIYSLSNSMFHFEDGYTNQNAQIKSATNVIMNWVKNNYGYANIIMGVFIGVWIKLFFKKPAYNIFEILILLCFVMGMGMLIYAIFGVFSGLITFDVMQIGGITGFIYTTWAIGDFYGRDKVMNYVKAFFAYFLGMLTFTLAAMLIGTLIDLMKL